MFPGILLYNLKNLFETFLELYLESFSIQDKFVKKFKGMFKENLWQIIQEHSSGPIKLS